MEVQERSIYAHHPKYVLRVASLAMPGNLPATAMQVISDEKRLTNHIIDHLCQAPFDW
jgi:hypothetical protein